MSERKEQINEKVINGLPLERMEKIIDFSKSFEGFNKDILDFLCSRCLDDHIDFEEALNFLRQGYNLEHVKLWYELKNHVSEQERILFIHSQKDFFEVVTSGADLSFLLNDNYNSFHVKAFLSAYKKHLPNEKINLLKNAKIHPHVINFFIGNPDKFNKDNVERVLEFNDSFNKFSYDHVYCVINAIIRGFSDEQIKAIINEASYYGLLYEFFKAGMPAKYVDSVVYLKNVPSYTVINALKENVIIEEIINAAKRGDEGKITLLTLTAKERRINKEFCILVKNYS